MKGYPVAVPRASSISPRVKQMVTSMMNPDVALSTTDVIIALGRVSEASLISSARVRTLEESHGSVADIHICTAQSYPIKAVIMVEKPTKVAVPKLPQSPPS